MKSASNILGSFSLLHSSRKNFSYLLVVSSSAWPIRRHSNAQSVSYHYTDGYARLLEGIQHRYQYYKKMWRAQGRIYSTTPLYFGIEFWRNETIFPILNPQNLSTENKFMYNKIFQCFRPTHYWLSVAFHHIFHCFRLTLCWLSVAFHHIFLCFRPTPYWLSVAFHHISSVSGLPVTGSQ